MVWECRSPFDKPLHELSAWDIPEDGRVAHGWKLVISAMVCQHEHFSGLLFRDTLKIVEVDRDIFQIAHDLS